MDLLRALLYGVSAQRPTHGLAIAGEPLPIEARMGGLFLGFLLALGLLALLGRLRSAFGPAPAAASVCWALVGLTGVDGLNAFFFDGGLPHLYAPNTPARLLTGLGAGYGMGLLSLPVVARAIWHEPIDEPDIVDCVELGAGAAVGVALGWLMLLDVAPLLWPISLAMLASVLLAFGSANVYLLTLATDRVGQARAAADLRGVCVSGLGLALLELAVLAAVRGVLASLGVRWGV